MKHLIIKIPIQSMSDIITNSSSELFCVISDSKDLGLIDDFLREIINGEDSDLEPSVYYNVDNSSIEIWVPYSTNTTFYKAGITAILNDKFGKDGYKIEFCLD